MGSKHHGLTEGFKLLNQAGDCTEGILNLHAMPSKHYKQYLQKVKMVQN